MSPNDLRRIQGEEVIGSDDDEGEGEGEGEDGEEEEEDESVGPRRRASTRSGAGSKKKQIRDDDEEEEDNFTPEGSEDDEDAEEEEEEEENHGRRPRRQVAKTITYAEEQAREVAQRELRSRPQRGGGAGANHSSDDERNVQTGYERPVHKSEVTLSDGRVVSDREFRYMLKNGENIRALRDGEKPHAPLSESEAAAAAAAAAASSEGPTTRAAASGAHHPGDVRRSLRPRQQVQHYTDKAAAAHSGDDSHDDKVKYVRPQTGGARGRPGAKSRKPGRSNRQSVHTRASHTQRAPS